MFDIIHSVNSEWVPAFGDQSLDSQWLLSNLVNASLLQAIPETWCTTEVEQAPWPFSLS